MPASTMVCKKSEYRRQFRKPSWESHVAHYQEKVDYRTYRRLLEHKHTFVPWDWESSSSSCTSSSSGSGDRPQSAPNINNNGGIVSRGHHKEQLSHPPQGNDDRRREAQQRLEPPAGDARGRFEQERGRRTKEGNRVQQVARSRSKPQPKEPTRPSTSPAKTRQAPPPGHAKPDQPTRKPPIAAYGWADSCRDIGAKLTYNVKSSAHPAYVHPAALRALKQREMWAAERQKEEDRMAHRGKPTARAVFTVIPPKANVWLTEYQSSYCSPTKPT